MTLRGSGRNPALFAILGATVAAAAIVALVAAEGLPDGLRLSSVVIATSALCTSGAFVMGRRSTRRPAHAPPSFASIEEAVDLAVARREEARLLFEAVDEGVIIVNTDLTIAEANPAARRLLGPKVAREGSPWREAVSLLDARGAPLAGSADPFARAVASGRKSEAVAHVRQGDKPALPVHVTVVPVEGAGPERRYMVAMRDRSDAPRQSQAIAELIAGIMHDLRTPLTAIQRLAELLMREPVRPEQRRTWAALLHAESLRLEHTIDEIFDDARLEMGKARLRCDDVALTTVIDTALAPLRAGQTHVIEVDAAGAPAVLHVDGPKVCRALTNLVANAAKYSPMGSTVRVRARSDAHGVLTFEVIDHGPGVPEEEHARIFEPFFRGAQWEGDATERVRGSGLGLAIVRSIARLHDGDALVRNHPDGGAVFTFTIGEPAACPHHVASAKR